MNARNPLLWIIGLAISSTLGAAEAPPTNRRAATDTDPSGAASPARVWNSESRETGLVISAKIRRYAQRVVKRFDHNGSGALEANEWASLPGDPRNIDANHDSVITVDELAGYLASYARSHPLHGKETAWRHLPQPPAAIFQPVTPADSPPAKPAAEQAGTPSASAGGFESAASAKSSSSEKGRGVEELRRSRKYYVAPSALPPGLPDWFLERDTNGDGQLTLDEFAPDGSAAQRRLFAEYDQNGDGVITPDEVMRFNKTSLEKGKSSAEQPRSSSSPREPGGPSPR